MPNLVSYIRSEKIYSALEVEILRKVRNTSMCNEFRTSSKLFLNWAQNDIDNVGILKTGTSTYFSYHFETCQKISDTIITFKNWAFDGKITWLFQAYPIWSNPNDSNTEL